MKQPVLHFGIPLKSKAVSRDWGHVSRLLSNTLASLLQQTCRDFRVIVAHHEPPDLQVPLDDRFVFLTADFPPPLYRDEMMVDKNRKREMIGHRLRQEGGSLLMYLDADDLLSNRLVEHVATTPAQHGYLVNKGYEFDSATGLLRWAPRFDRLCGSSVIIRWAPDELPERLFAPGPLRLRRYLDVGHAQWAALARTEQRPLQTVPFPGAVYVVNSGENHSVATQNIGWRRRLMRRVTPARRLSPALAREFSIARPEHASRPGHVAQRLRNADGALEA